MECLSSVGFPHCWFQLGQFLYQKSSQGSLLHFYHSFTGALATDLKNGSGILTIEIAVSIFMGKLNAEAYFENFKAFEPALRSIILALMRTKTKEQLETNKGKETLKLR